MISFYFRDYFALRVAILSFSCDIIIISSIYSLTIFTHEADAATLRRLSTTCISIANGPELCYYYIHGCSFVLMGICFVDPGTNLRVGRFSGLRRPTNARRCCRRGLAGRYISRRRNGVGAEPGPSEVGRWGLSGAHIHASFCHEPRRRATEMPSSPSRPRDLTGSCGYVKLMTQIAELE